ncbi:MAG: lysozyme [Flammeovirgaceae bacterium]|nr:lysozyme [Flammeovirgaceae bacterium]
MRQELLDSIKRSEGWRSQMYKDTLGIPTIGYGFAIKDLVLDEDVGEIILKRKIVYLIERIGKTFDWYKDMPFEVQDSIVEVCYQLGIRGFSKFKKTINFLKERDFLSAGDEFLDSKWAKQTPNRANRLADIVRKSEGK